MDLSKLKKIQNTNVERKKVLLRVDLNVPFENDKVSDLLRIERIVPTINFLLSRKCKVILLSHLGRPKGSIDDNYSLSRVLPALSKVINIQNIKFSKHCIGPRAEKVINETDFGELCLLENLRFYDGEENNDFDFAKQLSVNGDIYVNDAFSCSHRNHASIVGISKIIPSFAGIGFENEISNINGALETPARPLIAIVGGSKVSTKLKTIINIIPKADSISIGGAMANTFLAANGFDIGKSLVELEMINEAKEIINLAKKNNCEIILPEDVITAKELNNGAITKEFDVNNVPKESMILDIGRRSINYLINKINKSNTIVWNGPLGAFEFEPFDYATNEIAKHVANLTIDMKLTSVAGGGDTVSALQKSDSGNKFTYLSTAGGAFLEWLEGKTLPGIIPLIKK